MLFQYVNQKIDKANNILVWIPLEQRMTLDSTEHAYLQARELDAPFGWQHSLSTPPKKKSKPNYWAEMQEKAIGTNLNK